MSGLTIRFVSAFVGLCKAFASSSITTMASLLFASVQSSRVCCCCFFFSVVYLFVSCLRQGGISVLCAHAHALKLWRGKQTKVKVDFDNSSVASKLMLFLLYSYFTSC